MSPENPSIETSTVAPNKFQAIAELDQTAAQTDMSNEQYETTRASIEAAHTLVDIKEEEPKKADRPIANAAALLAIHQAAAQGDWDPARIKLAEDDLARKASVK